MPLGEGRATLVKSAACPVGRATARKMERTDCWKWPTTTTRNFVPRKDEGELQDAGKGEGAGKTPKERVTVCGFLSGRRLCPNYPVYSKRVWGGCPDRRTMDYALPNPTCLDVGKNDKLSFLRGCLSQMDGVLGGVNGYATLLGGGWPGCSPGLLFGPRRRVIR